jgi:hypothetical protein
MVRSRVLVYPNVPAVDAAGIQFWFPPCEAMRLIGVREIAERWFHRGP